ncbi:L,D-transpeptidase-like protein [Aliiruegeria haliotis]|uniref:L,D-transpeptidase-like protein n=1 Tax=Aliiruegeria haliotis TaxID=1280846 RepID=A0A2T0RJ39_9RHOB|nr:L,D-transpeptidase family protein [Aliiruegeria haliotis]PRY21151.1 L,D-transpeptidase-like protein [Aliiruegeria haliotis]
MIGLGHLLTLGALAGPAGVAGVALWHQFAFPILPPVVLRADIDKIVIDKSEREMVVYRDGEALKSYTIALGFSPEGDKVQEGDGRTPEGTFRIDRRNDKSKFHLSLGIDYPRPEDRAEAREMGVSPGGDIFIHGQPNRVPDHMMIPGDWTAGCMAVTNPEIQELFRFTPIGTIVEIRP